MSSSGDTLAPSGINWEQAMSNAARILSEIKSENKWVMGSPEFTSMRAAHAQAWIAFAREITMHARGQ